MSVEETPPKVSARERLSRLRRVKIVGGNRSLTTARIIGIQEKHTPENERIIGELIDAIARKDDVVLLEGVESSREVFKGQSSRHETYQLPERVHALGWDNLDARQQTAQLYRRDGQIIDEMLAAIDGKDYEKFDELNRQHEDIHAQIDEQSKIREASLSESIQGARRDFPNARIFAVAGANHLSEDSQATNTISHEPYAMVKPDLPEPNLEERYARSRRRIDTMN